MSRAGDIGRDAENKVRDYFIEKGYTYAKRIRLTGQFDEGDVVLGDGYPVAIEVKGGQGALKRAHSAGRELLDEIVNSDADIGFCVIKKERSAKVDEWLVVIPMSEYVRQLEQMYPPRQS